MKLSKVYAEGKYAVGDAQKYAPHAVLRVFENAKGVPVAQISLHRLLRRYEEVIDTLPATPDTLLVLLAGLEDPHNVGAVIRSAAAFGTAAILMPFEGQAPITDAVFKVSAGMAFRLPLVTFEGYQQVLSDLRRRGFDIVALDQNAPTPLAAATFAKPTVLVLGNEGSGIPNPVKPLLTTKLSIPMSPRAESLNVAAAAAVALAAWSAKHPQAVS